MAAAARVDAQGFTRCDACGQRFKNRHSCRRSALAGYMPRRPPGFEDLVEEARLEAEAERAAGSQLSFDDAAVACSRCGRTDLHVDVDARLCTSCMAADARDHARRVADWQASTGPSRGPP